MLKRSIAVGLLGLMMSAAQAGFVVSTDRVSYSGTVATYDSLTDAQTRTNGTSSIIPVRNTDAPYDTASRDLGMLFVDDVASYYSDTAIFMTAWYYTMNTDHGEYSGWGNPNNTNNGFIQIYDEGNDTIVSQSGYWNSTLDTFTLVVTGGYASYDDAYSRLWHTENGGAAETTKGDFVSWSLNITFSGLSAVYNAVEGGYEANGEPAAVSGSFAAVFENTSTTALQYNGYYSADLTFGMDSWAYANSDALYGDYYDSYFFSTDVVPVPASTPLALLGIAALLLAFRR